MIFCSPFVLVARYDLKVSPPIPSDGRQSDAVPESTNTRHRNETFRTSSTVASPKTNQKDLRLTDILSTLVTGKVKQYWALISYSEH